AFVFHFLDRDEAQGGGTNGVTSSSRRSCVGENVANMRITQFRAYFRPLHVVGVVRLLKNAVGGDWLGERWPTGSAIEFIKRAEERIVGDDIDVNARLGIVPILVPKRRLRFV